MIIYYYCNIFLQHANEDVEKMILGNKCDMEDKRVVNKTRGEGIAREHGISFLETSAKANINIEKAFTDLTLLILNKTPGREPTDVPEKISFDKKSDRLSNRCC